MPAKTSFFSDEHVADAQVGHALHDLPDGGLTPAGNHSASHAVSDGERQSLCGSNAQAAHDVTLR